MEALLDTSSLFTLAVLTAGCAGAAAGWLVSAKAMPGPAAHAIARLSARLGEQAEALSRVETGTLDQISRSEADCLRNRSQMESVAGVLQRLALAQTQAEAAAQDDLRELRGWALRRDRGLIAGLRGFDQRVSALERRLDEIASTDPDLTLLSQKGLEQSEQPSRGLDEEIAVPDDLSVDRQGRQAVGSIDPLDLPDRVVAVLT